MTTVCFSIALNGYASRFRSCINSQKDYCKKHEYEYLCIDRLPWNITARQSAWLKVEVLQGLMLAGADFVAFLDADCEIREHTPDFRSIFNDHDSGLRLAPGKSGRLNSGVIFAKRSNSAIKFLQGIISKCDDSVPKEDATQYENGHFIHYGRKWGSIEPIEHIKWNNNSSINSQSYIQHYSGGDLRSFFDNEKLSRLAKLRWNVAKAKATRANVFKEDLRQLPISEFLRVARAQLVQTYNLVCEGS